jgi:beta-ribofuranosylaminobenzene 5'-phosphate synthase
LKIHVKTPSRLHFGIIDLGGKLGRGYGAIGLAIDEPGYEILVEEGKKLEVIGPEEDVGRAKKIAEKVARLYGFPPEAKINILDNIPRHVGLSSTTQLTLAVATAITKLHGVEASPIELAYRTGRGKVSGIGTYAFAVGGFIADGGVKRGRFSPLIFCCDFPEEWRFVVATPEIKRRLDEKAEKKLFRRATAPASIARAICHLLVMKMLPSLMESDIESFGGALTEVQRLVGKAFSPYQGGIFRGRIVSDVVNHMLKHGAYGVGQSSWGPTVYGLAENVDQADELMEKVKKFLQSRDRKAVVRVAKPNNRGAKVKIED